jgi:hypothetical protein
MNPQHLYWFFFILTPLSAIFQYIMVTRFSGGDSQRTTDPGQTTGKLYHLRVEFTLFCNLQSWVRTRAVLVIGLYELFN